MIKQFLINSLIEGKEFILAHYKAWALILLIFVIGYFLIKLVNRYLARLFDKLELDPTLEIFIQRATSVILWLLLLVIILGNLGINIGGLIAGISVGGFIVGFAIKDVLANLAAGMLLLINRPFKVGEEVEIAGIKGKVKEIGISACIIISENNEWIVIPNAKIWGNPIKNFSRLKK